MWMLFLLVAWAAAIASCARLCRAAVAAADLPDGAAAAAADHALGLYEMAFLSGGPRRVTELAMVTMGRDRRLLLARTGWATVVDPDGRDAIERSLIAATGPEGQAPVPAIRAAHATSGEVRALARGLADAGLAVPPAARESVSTGLREVRAASVLILVTLVAATTLSPAGRPLLPWFALPLLVTLGCLAIARFEIHPYTRWAAPAGRELLRTVDVPHGPAPDDRRQLLTALAVRGPSALPDPALRAALS
ncbi:TIGR04222 domain-containing membrane protein [Actinacidiphila sp. bgisy160]|uniref:TIGR04222 domain-containing membrane protein n=1 Tax=Actinacidiphila sp. bgisy160 TaxID=3413796 RepID=UPI003D758407